MADKSISELPTINAVTGDECLYGIQSDGDVKIVADDLVDYILNTYEFNSGVTNANVIAGKINSLRTLTNTADLADKTYPPGSLYWSSSSTSPASILGGTWTRVKDRFALAAGSSYTAGTNGGEAVHLLTISEIPSHNHGGATGGPSNNTSSGPSTNTTGADAKHSHGVPALSGTAAKNGKHTHTVDDPRYVADDNMTYKYAVTYNSNAKASWESAGAHTHPVTTTAATSGNQSQGHTHSMAHTHNLSSHTHTLTSQGGGGSHNNMPPYVVKYCWERIE